MSRAPTTFSDIRTCLAELPGPNADAISAADTRNAQLTKPPAALGRLEELARWYAGWRGTGRPILERPQVVIFAGNHGIAARGVSAFPPEVTAQMVANFQNGGAAINQLSRAFGARMDVHALHLDRPTADFTQSLAMAEDEALDAFATGWNAVDPDTDLLVTGEMGIGNTTSAAAIAHALFGGRPEDWVGRGTGVDDAGLTRKALVVAEGVTRHGGGDGLDTLARLGGREIAAMAGAILRARVDRIPVILDGFICCSAAACLQSMSPWALDHCVAGHVSAEAGHTALLDCLGLDPLLSLGLRLGEGSGAALAIGVLKGAVACHSGMATFEEAGVAAG